MITQILLKNPIKVNIKFADKLPANMVYISSESTFKNYAISYSLSFAAFTACMKHIV